MRNIFLFIRRYFHVLFFLILEIISLSMLFSYNKYHEAIFMGVSNEVTGKFYSQYNNVENYFHLRYENDRLAKENLRLLNELKDNYQQIDTTAHIRHDSLPFDTLGHVRQFAWREADVINNSVIFPNNYITLNRGESQGVRKDMGVVGPDGLVGTVVNTSDNIAVVMSMLHKQSKVSGMLKKTMDAGRIEWDGSNPEILLMRDIPKSVKVAVGDTVVTSTYSDKFPAGILIGTINKIDVDQASNFYLLRLKSATRFTRLQHVFVVENLRRQEQLDLETATKKAIK